MSRRRSVVQRGEERGRDALRRFVDEARLARIDRGLSQDAVAGELGMDRAWISRLEGGRLADVGIVRAARLAAIVGLELSLRTFPGPGALRDAPQLAVLGRFRSCLHRTLGWTTEVPLPLVADLRAWDAVVTGRGWRCAVEVETRPRDLQALLRRLQLKLRDGDVDHLILVLPDTRYNRAVLRDHGAELAGLFPVPGARALELLRAGVSPGGNAIVLI